MIIKVIELNLPRRVGFARVGVLVPSAIRIMNASKTIVVSSGAHNEINLLDAMIGSDVELLVFLGYLHGLYWFTGCNVKDV